MRVQFSVTDDEWKKLQKLAAQTNYPDVPTYCKDLALLKDGERTYGRIWKIVVNKIGEMKSGTEFALRDLVATPPSNLGVKLFNHQKELNIERLQKDATKTNIYRKL